MNITIAVASIAFVAASTPYIGLLHPLSSAASLQPREQEPPKADDGTDPARVRDVSLYNIEKNKLAIKGYDPVGYFPEGGGKARKGSEALAHTHRGVVYRFATQENLDRFKKDPNKYEPTYGGWCASAMADGGRKVEIDPENFKVTDGRLFLFYKSFLQDAQDYWKKDEKKHTKEADDQWRKLTKEEPRRAKKPEGGK